MAFDARVAAAVLAAVVIATAYLFVKPMDVTSVDEGPPYPDANVHASASAILSGRSISLSATGSTGEIVEYRWALGDGRQMTGENVTASYEEMGRYRIMLTVVDSLERSDSDFVLLSVNVETWHNGTVDQGEPTDTYGIEVFYDDEAERPERRSQGITINLTYDADPQLTGENNLTMSLRDPDDNVVRRHPDEWGEVRGTGMRYALIVVAYQETAGRGGEWEVEVDFDRSSVPGGSVDYVMSVTVFY
ncbi:MAG: PKD domain-containing protein [Thermoplasmata archaeon]|nr:PKD domain-containing protein [Thermoplasmata archaeon]